VPKLLSLSKFGLGSLDDAIPIPNAGCIINNGPAAVSNPSIIA
jgi:hypothetical protein